MTKSYLQINKPYLLLKLLISHPSLWFPVLRYLRTVLLYFFVPQFQTAMKLSRRPVINIEHPLDSLIPYSPEYLDVYLSFVNLWLDSLLHFYNIKGKSFIPSFIEFINDINRLYFDAGLIYKTMQSTSRRPRGSSGFKMSLVRLVDPHLHCVPSLHVAVVIFALHSIKKYSRQFSENPAQETLLEAHYDHGRQIMESILLVKQHSINCVAAGLFFCTAAFPEIAADEIKKIVRDMFTQPGSCVDDPREIHLYIESLYSIFSSHLQNGHDSKAILVEFLKNYR
jgi:hypothetical protein